jgi:hypothetical protein
MIFQLMGIAICSVLLSLAITKAIKPKPKPSDSVFSYIRTRQEFEKLILPPDSVLLCLVVVDDHSYSFNFTHFTWVDLQDCTLRELISESWYYYSHTPSKVNEVFSMLVTDTLTPEVEEQMLDDLLGGKYPYIWCVGNSITTSLGFVVGNN